MQAFLQRIFFNIMITIDGGLGICPYCDCYHRFVAYACGVGKCFLLIWGSSSGLFHFRSAEATALLSEAIAHGVAAGEAVCIRSDPGLEELLSMHILTSIEILGRTDHDHYTMTQYGRQLVKQCTRLHSPQQLPLYERKGLDTDLEQYTTLELVRLLGLRGWTDKQRRKSVKIQPYRSGCDKVWYHSDQQKTLSKLYLRVLASSDELFENSDVLEIYHFQGQAYYSATLKGLKVLPDQPLAYYKIVIKNAGLPENVGEEEHQEDMDPSNLHNLCIDEGTSSLIFISLLCPGPLIPMIFKCFQVNVTCRI